MINKILLLISFATSSICFIDLVKDKKKYGSLIIFISILLCFLFIRPLLILWTEYHNQFTYLEIIIGILFLVFYIVFKRFSDEYTHCKNMKLLLIDDFSAPLYIFISVLCLVYSIYFYNSLGESSNFSSFKYSNTQLIDYLKTTRSNAKMYDHIKNNLQLVVINLYYVLLTAISTLLLFRSAKYICIKDIQNSVLFQMQNKVLMYCLLFIAIQ